MPFLCKVFDCHCDTVTLKNLNHTNSQLKKRDIKRYDSYTQVFAICSENGYAYSHAVENIRKFRFLMKKWGIEHITDKNSLKNARYGGILALEGADAFFSNLTSLDYFYNRGVRLVTLTWNNNNAVATSVTEKNDKGLTDFGKSFVKRCGELGIVVDLSHIGDKGFYDVCECLDKPFICSHSNSRSICNHPRNITDEMFSCIIKKGGVTGINFYKSFLGNGKADDVLKHIEHFCSLGGAKNIGMGSDFDGISQMPEGCRGASFFYEIAESLLRLNYSEKIVNDILHGNFLRLFEKII